MSTLKKIPVARVTSTVTISAQLSMHLNGKSSPFTLSHFIKVTGHTSAVEMNQRKVRNSILFKFKPFLFCCGYYRLGQFHHTYHMK